MNAPNSSETSYFGAIMAGKEEFAECLNIPCERRQKLLYELGNILEVDQVPAPFWACLQVCDLGQLTVIVENARHNPLFVSSFAEHCSHHIPLLWLQEPQEPDEDPASISASSVNASHIICEQSSPELYSTEAAERDGGICVSKGTAPMVVAHIYPEFNENDPHAMVFWDLLSIFWPPGKLRLWKELIYCEPHNPTKVTDACFNSICISPEIHRIWRMGVFALRPLEYNTMMTELEVEWYWQPKEEHSVQDSVPLNKLPLSSSGLDSTKSKTNLPVNLLIELSPDVMRRVKTEDKFVLKTQDPDRLPLPSKDLLELQFNLQRISSMTGASGLDRLDLSYGDDSPPMSGLKASYIEQWLASSVSGSNGHA